MLSRNQEQVKSMQIIYNYLFNMSINEKKEITTLIEEICDCSYDEAPLFIKEAVVKAIIHLDESIELIKNNLTTWTIERMNKTTIAILVLALTEAKYMDEKELFKAAIIDVAINLTKKYCEDNAYKFVNAFLDKNI